MTRPAPLPGWCPAEAGVPKRLPVLEVAELSPDERYRTAVPVATEFSAFTRILSIPEHAKVAKSLLRLTLCCLQIRNAQYSCGASTRPQHKRQRNIITVMLCTT